jgi:peptidoglycan/LPS O-acetylase OafA/YrhL
VRPAKLKAVAVSLSLLALVIRVVWAMHGGLGQGMTMMTFGRMDALLLGALGAILFRDAAAMGRIRRWLPWIALAMLGGFLAAMALLFGRSESATSFFVQTVGYSMLALGFGALVLQAAATEGTATWLQRILRHAALTRLGAYSYGFYVFHVPIIGAAKLVILPHLSPGMQQNPWFSLVFIVVLGLITFGISAASYELFEAPILSCKRYFGPRFASSSEIGDLPAPLSEPAKLS